MLAATSSTGQVWNPRCWVCGKVLGPHTGRKPDRYYTATVAQDGGGTQHLTHSVCSKDVDGKIVGITSVKIANKET